VADGTRTHDNKNHKTKPDTRYVTEVQREFARHVARERGGMYVINMLCLRAAYLTVSWPDEMRHLLRQEITEPGVRMPVGKCRGGRAQKYKLIEWSDELCAVIDETLKLQRTSSPYVFGNSEGQPYTTSRFNTHFRRQMGYCEKKTREECVEFTRSP
jgi:hypothetical protein